MKLIQIKRRTRQETRYSKRMGVLTCNVTTIWKTLLGWIPIKKIYQYRDTYYGEIKELDECNLNK